MGNGAACNFIKKETLVQVFSCEFCEISKTAFFKEHVWATAFLNTLTQINSNNTTDRFLWSFCAIYFLHKKRVWYFSLHNADKQTEKFL